MNRNRHGYTGDGETTWRDRPVHKDSDEIRADIERTRVRLDHTIDQLQDRLSPSQYIRAACDALRSSTADSTTAQAVEMLRRNVVPIALVGLGIIWFAVNQSRQRSPVPRERAIVQYEEDEIFSEAAI